MLKINKLYRPFYLEYSYKDIEEERVLTSLYDNKIGTIEMVISKLINEAVIRHMHIDIDSTIMQIYALNEYLVKLFTKNIESLIFNYCVHYLEENNIKEIEEWQLVKIEEVVGKVNRQTDLAFIKEQLEQFIVLK